MTLGWIVWVEFYARPRGWVALLHSTVPEPLIYGSVPLGAIMGGAFGWSGAFLVRHVTEYASAPGRTTRHVSIDRLVSRTDRQETHRTDQTISIVCEMPTLYIGEQSLDSLFCKSETPPDLYSPWINDAAWAVSRHRDLSSATAQLAQIRGIVLEALTAQATPIRELNMSANHPIDTDWFALLAESYSSPRRATGSQHTDQTATLAPDVSIQTTWVISGLSEYVHPVDGTMYVPWLVQWPVYHQIPDAGADACHYMLMLRLPSADRATTAVLADEADRYAGLIWSIAQSDSQAKPSATLVQWYRNERCSALLDRSMNIDSKLNGIGRLSSPVLWAASMTMGHHSLQAADGRRHAEINQSMLGLLHREEDSMCWEWHRL